MNILKSNKFILILDIIAVFKYIINMLYKGMFFNIYLGVAGLNIYIGVDGGCTKTSLVAVGPDGEVLGGITGEGINFDLNRHAARRDNLSAPVKALIRQVGADGYETIFIGMSALYNNPDKSFWMSFARMLSRSSAL